VVGVPRYRGRVSSAVTTVVLAAIPSPDRGVWYLGPIPIRAYALCIIAGIVVAVLWGERRFVARGGEPGTVTDVAVFAVPFGLVGGRLYHVATDWQNYFGPDGDPIDALKIWQGGLGIWGAIALGGVGAWIGCRRRGVPLPFFADAVAPGIVAAQAIGRLGNWFNQELYGGPTTLPWGLEIYRRVNPETGAPDGLGGVALDRTPIEVVHPIFLYELLWNLAVAALVVWADRRFRLGHGRAFALYVAGYTAGRFWIEQMRTDYATRVFGDVRINVVVSAVVFLGAVAYLVLVRKPREALPTTQRADGDEPVDDPGAGGAVPVGVGARPAAGAAEVGSSGTRPVTESGVAGSAGVRSPATAEKAAAGGAATAAPGGPAEEGPAGPASAVSPSVEDVAGPRDSSVAEVAGPAPAASGAAAAGDSQPPPDDAGTRVDPAGDGADLTGDGGSPGDGPNDGSRPAAATADPAADASAADAPAADSPGADSAIQPDPAPAPDTRTDAPAGAGADSATVSEPSTDTAASPDVPPGAGGPGTEPPSPRGHGASATDAPSTPAEPAPESAAGRAPDTAAEPAPDAPGERARDSASGPASDTPGDLPPRPDTGPPGPDREHRP
jgi:prolipoprotein diacylglyceryl transferase